MATATARERTLEKTQLKGAAAGAPPERLVSLDVLRGFDMFWIFGGDELVKNLAKATGLAWLATVALQFEHAAWAGFHFYDLIFPLFIFISGITLPIALGRRRERGESRARIVLRLARRTLLLIALGLLYNNGPVSFDVDKLRFCSVLGRIGLAGFGAGLIVLFVRPRDWIWWVAGTLGIYWALMTFVPVPGQPVHSFEQAKNLADWIDIRVIPGKFVYNNNHEPQGLLSTIPSVGLALLGAMAGIWLTSARSHWVKGLGLLGAGALLLGLGWAWSYQFPLIKHLWTSSFILFAAGWSCLLLAFFYAIVDGLRWRRWAFPFLLIGMNPLTIYFLRGTKLIDFSFIGKYIFGFAIAYASKPWAPVCTVLAMMAVQFVFLWWLWRNKIFLRV